MTDICSVIYTAVPTEDALSWHHLSKDQVIKGIILQLCGGELPHKVSILIWRDLKRRQKTDEDLQRSYYDQGIRLITQGPRIIPDGGGLEWLISIEPRINSLFEKRCSPMERRLSTIRMIGDDNFLYEKVRVPIDPDHPLGPCQISYEPASLKSK